MTNGRGTENINRGLLKTADNQKQVCIGEQCSNR